MEFRNDSKLEKTVRYVYYFISGIFCLFLILLSSRILDDLGSSVAYPEITAFENKTLIDSLSLIRDSLNAQVESYNAKAAQLTKASDLAKANYESAKESFDNWLEARKILDEPSKDREVIAKTEALDGYHKIQQDWNRAYAKIQDTLDTYNNALYNIDNELAEERNRAGQLFSKAVQRYELHVFLIRLLFILPILFIGIYFYVRHRRHKYWPLFIGFTLFSVYAFFVGLVPYLPSYGGYVRYSVGVLLSAAGGYYVINNIRTYLESRKQEMQKSTEERSRKVESDIVFKAYDQHLCPSCGKDFIYKSWASVKQNVNDSTMIVSNFCRQCGFELYKNCPNCGEKHFAHLPFCSNCGTGNKPPAA